MNERHQINLIGLDKLNVLDWLKVHIPDMQLTGSLSLLAYGVYKTRIVGDIDIVSFNPSFANALVNNDSIETDGFTSSEGGNNESQQELRSVRIKKDGISIDCFLSDSPQDCKDFDFIGGRKFKVSYPKYSIKAKREYITALMKMDALTDFRRKKLYKHTQDIIKYNEWLEANKMPFDDF